MTIPLHIRILIVAPLLLSSFAPLLAQAAEPPVCMLGIVSKNVSKVFTNDTVEVARGATVYVLWASAQSTSAINNSGNTIAATGFVAVVPTATETYTYTFRGNGSTVTCSTTLKVAELALEGPTNVSVATVPLLNGGIAYPGTSVPVAYIQMYNAGPNATTVHGVALTQRGTASTDALIGFSVIDDKGISVTVTGGATASKPFINGEATAVMDAVLLSGQRRLFTVRAIMAPVLTNFTGSTIILDMTGVNTTASVSGTLPIRGTAWTIQ